MSRKEKPEPKPYGWPIKAWEDAEASLLIYNGRIADQPQAAIANVMLAMEPYIQARVAEAVRQGSRT